MSSKKPREKDKQGLCCEVCMTLFVNRQSLRRHVNNKHHTLENCSTLPDFLKDLLPAEKTLALNVKQVDDGYTAEIFLPTVNTRERLHWWVNTFMKINNCTFVRTRASKNATKSILVQEHYQCEHHSTPNPVKRKKVSKGTNCKSTIYAVLKKSSQNITWVHLNFVHNHLLASPELLRFKKPTDQIREIFIRMFEDGAAPADALRYFKIHVKIQLTEKEFAQYSTDRSKVPDYDWVRHFFHKTVKKKFTALKSPEYLQSVKQIIESNVSEDLTCILSELGDDNFFIVIITPLMKHILQTKQAGDIMFIDSCGNVERFGLKVYLLFTKIHSNEAPIGVIIISQDITLNLTQAFHAFLDSLNPDAFGGRCKKGPNFVLTDENATEIAAIKSVFSSSNEYLCIPHFLRSCHRWLLKPKNEVNAAHRKSIYSVIRQMVYAPDERTFSRIFTTLSQNYENHVPVKRFTRQLFDKRKKWATCFRTDSILKNNHTNCLVNFELRILKEQIFEKIKSQSASQLLNFIITDFNDFYKQKFIDCCLGNLRYFKTKDLTKDDLSNYAIIQVSDSLFVVYSKSKRIKYVINADIGVCTCYVGASGNFCKHQQFLSNSKKAFYTPIEYPNDDETRAILYFIATGDINIPENLYSINLREVVAEDVEQYYNIIEEVTEEVVENLQDCEMKEECVIELPVDDQIQEMMNHFNDISNEIKSRKEYYLDALINFNQQLDSIKDNPDALLNAMYSFNSN